MKVTYNDNVLTLPEGTTPEAAKEALKAIYPEIANATHVETEDGIEFTVQAGKKGADLKVVYGDNTLSLPSGTTPEDAKEALKAIYPEIANASHTLNGDTLTFTVEAGKKGSDDLKVVYGDNTLSLPAGTEVSDARDALKAIYPEIANASHTLEDGVLTFTVEAGKKGN